MRAVVQRVSEASVAVEGEKVVRTMRDTTTSVGIVTGQDISERQIRDLAVEYSEK